MVSKQTIKVLIEAEEKVSKVAQKAEKALDKLGNAGKKGMEGINSASSKLHSGMSKLSSFVDRARNKFNELKNGGSSAGSAIRNAMNNASSTFSRLTTNANSAKLAMEKIKSVSDGIQGKLSSLTSKISSFGTTAKTKLTQAFNMGNIKAKLKSVGTSIDQLKVKMKQLATQSKGTGGGFGFLRTAASMTVGMIGYDLVNAFAEAGRAAINANSQLAYFGKRLNLSGAETKKFESSLEEMQKSFQKVNMKAVGASAEEMAVKLKLPKSSLEDLTKTTAVMSSAFVKEGRTQEDAILAVSDAMDGQFRRLQELGISQEALKNNGWDGDIENKDSLLKAMNKTLDEMGFTETAQDITSLDEAYQALTVQGGILLEKVLVPLTPILLGIMKAVSGAMNAIGGFIQTLQNLFSGLPEWAKIGIAIAAIAVSVGLLISYFGGLEAILLSAAGAIAPLVTAITGLSLPIVAVVAAIGLVIAAIYEVGKAFGWWKDAGTMMKAITDNIGRLWDAFINHPDVQAAIKSVTEGLTWLAGAVGNAWQEVLKFFGVSSSSNWDVTRSIIEGIGIAWELIGGKIKFAIGILQGAWGVLTWLVSSAVGIGQGIWNALKPIVCILLGCSPGIVPALRTVQQVFTTVWNAIVGFVSGIVPTIIAIISRLVQIPLKVGQYLRNTLTKIISIGTQWVKQAQLKARALILAVITLLKQLPGKVYSALHAVVSRIRSAIQAWITAAKAKVSSLITSITSPFGKVSGAIRNALSGVKNAITAPFKAAWNMVKPYVDKIQNALNFIPSFSAGEGVDSYGNIYQNGVMVGNVNDLKTQTQTTTSEPVISEPVTGSIDINHELNLKLDLINVPAHIDEQQLITMLQSKAVLKEIATSPEFQNLDIKMKNILNAKSRRARGA